MRSTSYRSRQEARRLGESAVGTCLLLSLLVVVAFIATFTSVKAFYRAQTTSRVAGQDDGSVENSDLGDEANALQSGGSGSLCRGLERMEVWGTAVNWGSTNKLETAEACCQQCKDRMEKCNSWVYCFDEAVCKDKFKECWLKRQADVLLPELHGSGASIGWMSGIIHPEGKGLIQFETPRGSIRIKLLPTWAPRTVNYIRELVALRHCTGCQFYRAEGLGKGWDADGLRIQGMPAGPPYALLQGSLYTDGIPYKPIPVEGAPLVKRGHLCLVAEGPDFFISLGEHPEWGHGHTVFGEVLPEDMPIVDELAREKTKATVWADTAVRELEEPINFAVKRWTSR
eukprot:TRINITY_DN26331_c0_g1_i1.p1 TRINITY_DN26331_c0_g1~~TRINITY_DN26331_c0_g1_i1.p1  ORF type:complete len:342 (-),score=25.04 TRINITY_DN26331_c0_g1_i1:781-1806(-)